MKILKISASGYRLLANNFTIDFLTKARVSVIDKEDEIIALKENLYIPTTTVFTGKNSSGKSTVLDLLMFVQELFYFSRIKYRDLDFREDKIKLEIYFLHNGYIYKYKGTIHKPTSKLLDEGRYCTFKDEKLYRKKYYKSYGKSIYNLSYEELNEYKSDIEDTSIVYKLSVNKTYTLAFDFYTKNNLLDIFINLMQKQVISSKLKMKIINLFDDSIKKFDYDEENKLYLIDIDGIGTNYYGQGEVNKILSDGTKKGLVLFAMSILIMNLGGTLIIDEIENSFHKNLVENIIMIFNDKRINKNNANLIFSTHYVEILDIFRRRDNIYILNKDKYITANNMYEDYKDRIDLVKSNQFNNNTFNTLLNYDKLMEIKRNLIDEISVNVRREK